MSLEIGKEEKVMESTFWGISMLGQLVGLIGMSFWILREVQIMFKIFVRKEAKIFVDSVPIISLKKKKTGDAQIIGDAKKQTLYFRKIFFF